MTTMQELFAGYPIDEPIPVTEAELALLDHLLSRLQIRALEHRQAGLQLELSRARYKLAAEAERLRGIPT